jgi:hypothetical protein
MSRLLWGFVSICLLGFPSEIQAHNPVASNPTAVAFAAQSMAALTGGTSVTDVTLTGSVTWTAGSDTETGSATLMAVGTGESRMDLALSTGTRTEIRDAQTGTALGEWILPGGTSGRFASYNCQTDAVWFFPALGSLTTGQNVVLSYIGQETHNGASVQHLQSYLYQPLQSVAVGSQPTSAMDFYLDATTLLPTTITFNIHADNNAGLSIPVEIDFSNYQVVNGVVIPMHIQKYLQGTLMVDLTISSSVVNTGIALSNFTIN